MASISNWIPIEWDANVLARVAQASVVEGKGRGYTMGSDTKRILRSLAMSVGVGSTYSPDGSTNDYITLVSEKLTGQFIVDEDDLSDADSVIDTLRTKSADWATSYAVAFDNACLGATGTVGSAAVPFPSVYQAVRTDGVTGENYTADDNYTKASSAAADTYSDLSQALAKAEGSLYYNRPTAMVIANPGFLSVLREVKDDNNRPIFVQGQGGDAGQPDSLFGLPIFWTHGAKVSTDVRSQATGKDLLIFCGNNEALMRGDRMGPEALIDVARAHDSTDETALKLRVRKAFHVAHPKAFSVLEAA